MKICQTFGFDISFTDLEQDYTIENNDPNVAKVMILKNIPMYSEYLSKKDDSEEKSEEKSEDDFYIILQNFLLMSEVHKISNIYIKHENLLKHYPSFEYIKTPDFDLEKNYYSHFIVSRKQEFKSILKKILSDGYIIKKETLDEDI